MDDPGLVSVEIFLPRSRNGTAADGPSGGRWENFVDNYI